MRQPARTPSRSPSPTPTGSRIRTDDRVQLPRRRRKCRAYCGIRLTVRRSDVHFRRPQHRQRWAVASWTWTFGSAGTATSPSPSFRFPSPGTYPVSLTVADDDGASATATASIEVRAAIHSAIVAAGTETGGNRNAPSWWRGNVTTEVHGADERPIAGATVSAAWSGGWSNRCRVSPTRPGRCTFKTSPLGMDRTSVTFTVTSVAAPLSVYTPSANHNDAGGATSTSVTVNRPPR